MSITREATDTTSNVWLLEFHTWVAMISEARLDYLIKCVLMQHLDVVAWTILNEAVDLYAQGYPLVQVQVLFETVVSYWSTETKCLFSNFESMFKHELKSWWFSSDIEQYA